MTFFDAASSGGNEALTPEISGVEKLNLDTGHATVRSKEHEKAALCGSRTTETVEEPQPLFLCS